MARLPHVNHETPLGLSTLNWQEEVYEDEFLTRLQLVMGLHPSSDLIEYGIVDSSDPASVSEASTRPLVPYRNALDGTKFDLRPGIAVTKSGFVMALTVTQSSIQTPTTDVGDQFVILLEYATTETTSTLTRYDTLTGMITVVVDEEDLLQVVAIEDWVDATVFPDSRKDHCVVLAVVDMASSGPLGKHLSFTYTGTTYDYNRPWFSPIDIYHRTQLGTGSQTSNNPHALGLNDLASGSLTLYQQILEHGMVLSKDYSVSRVPGIKCYEDIEPSRWQLDDSAGRVTGQPGAYWAPMGAYPIRLGIAVDSTVNDPTTADIVCVYLIPGTNILVMSSAERALLPVDDLRVHYMAAYASQPPVNETDLRELTFNQIQSGRELIISDGLAVDLIPNLTVDLSNFGALPTWIRIFMDGSGNYVVTPTCIVPTTKLNSVVLGSANDVSTSLLGPSRLRVGVAQATSGATLLVTITITGFVNGVVDTETLAWVDTAWNDPAPIPNCQNAIANEIAGSEGQYLVTTKLFDSVTSWTLDLNTATGPISEIMIHALPGFPDVTAMREYVPICEVNWSGLNVCTIRDIRPVNKLVQVPKKFSPLTMAAKLLQPGGVLNIDPNWYNDPTPPPGNKPYVRPTHRYPEFEVTVEDMEDPRYNALISPDIVYTNLMADHWQEGLGENCFVRGDLEHSKASYISRPFYVPHEGTGLVSEGFPQYNGLRFFVLWDDDPERSSNFWGGGRRNSLGATGYDSRPTPEIRYTTRSNPTVWRGWYELQKEASGSAISHFTNVWFLNAYDNALAAYDYFYKFQVRLEGPGKTRGWVAMWEKIEQLNGISQLGGWDVNHDNGNTTYDDVLDNSLFSITITWTGTPHEYQVDFTYDGYAPTSAEYGAWISGSGVSSNPTDLFSIVKDSGTDGRFLVYEQQAPDYQFGGPANIFTMFIRVSSSL